MRRSVTAFALPPLLGLVLLSAGCEGPRAQAAPSARKGGEVAKKSTRKGRAEGEVVEGATKKSVRIGGVPHIHQKPDFCGEAVLASALQHRGHGVSQDEVFAHSGVDPALGRGAYAAELVKAAKAFGFDVGRVWHHIAAKKAAKSLDSHFAALHADLLAGVPSIVCTRYDKKPKTTEHFRLILGYDKTRDEVLYHEPAVTKGAYKRMKRTDLLSLWPLKYQSKRWTVIRLRLDAKKITAAKIAAAKASAQPAGRFSPADFAQHIRRLRPKIPKGFKVVVQPPFVVLGDESRAMVKRRAVGTVRWATMRLKKAYFDQDPLHIIDVWLFKNKRSYRHNAWRLFRHRPSTPYGYYSSDKRALVMNISTGGGTLVHEIVHPFVEANFPNCPPWFNEGLGSLYEQCGDRRGQIMGFTNWRLPGLQAALRQGRVPTFFWLTSRSTTQFYDHDPGTNYGQSRYLVYYLQEHNLLRRYYKAFHAARSKDPTGYLTLKKILKARDMKAFQRRWKKWVLKLRYR